MITITITLDSSKLLRVDAKSASDSPTEEEVDIAELFHLSLLATTDVISEQQKDGASAIDTFQFEEMIRELLRKKYEGR